MYDELALGDRTAEGIRPNALQAVLLLWRFKCSGLWSHVQWGAPDISKVSTAYIFRGSTPTEDNLRLLDPEDESTTILWNNANYLSNDEASQSTVEISNNTALRILQHYVTKPLLCVCITIPPTNRYLLPLQSSVVTICTTSLTFNTSMFCPHSVFVCFGWIWEQTAIISLHRINWLVGFCNRDEVCLLCDKDWIYKHNSG